MSTTDAEMTAHVIEEYGGPEVFGKTEVPVPEPGPDELRIEVVASSVNPVDYKIRRGDIPDFAPEFPARLGCDVSGVVDAVGAEVDRFEPGDEVYGMPGGAGRQGVLADYAVGHAGTFASAPESIPLADAAALPIVALTAWEMLADKTSVDIDDDVLVYGASGGVGHIGVQVATWFGAKTVATGSTVEKRALAAELGADDTVDYTATDVDDYVAKHTDGVGFDTVFDPIGGGHLATAFEAVRPFGSVVTTVARDDPDFSITPIHEQSLSLSCVLVILPIIRGEGQDRIGDELGEIASLVDDGAIEPVIDARFGFDDAAAAHELVESGEFVGKVLLENE